MIWKDLKRDNHAWAFYYFLKRMGDKPKLVLKKDRMDIIVQEKVIEDEVLLDEKLLSR